jgi:hypothetical protein
LQKEERGGWGGYIFTRDSAKRQKRTGIRKTEGETRNTNLKAIRDTIKEK